MSSSEIEIKTERLAKMMKSENLGGVLLKSKYNFAWLTGGKDNGVDKSREFGVSNLLVRNDGKRFLLASKIEMERMLTEEISDKDFEPVEFAWEDEKANPNFVLEKSQSLFNDNLQIAADVFFNPQTPVIEGKIDKCRFQLTDCEIERFRRSSREAGGILERIYTKIEVGQTEKSIADTVCFEFGKLDFNLPVVLVAADERIAKFRHPIPTDNVWKKVLMIVVCAQKHGLISPLTRFYCAGKIPGELRKITDINAKIHAQMMHATRPGTLAKQIFEIAKKSYGEAGFPGEETKHHQGGACGYKTRDWLAHTKSSEPVNLNQAFAWNPSITGTKSEETNLVTQNGIEIITSTENFPRIVNVIDGIEYLTPNILEI